MTKKTITLTWLLCLLAGNALFAQQSESVSTPKIGGTIRGKYEFQTEEGKGRFEVRTARINVTGDLTPMVSYKAEIDLCDEGQIKMLDAYTRIRPMRNFQFVIGQMRVPFTIDAHRSPDKQYFANRSFIAKQVGNVRDVGAKVGYQFHSSQFHSSIPIVLEAGIYNGSGLTNQKDFWTSNINFSTKAQLFFPMGIDLEVSAQKIRPSDVNIMMYDAGVTYHHRGFIAEAEYLYKHYDQNAFHPVHTFDGFVSYDIPLNRRTRSNRCLFTKVSPLLRYDYMSDHSDGKRYLDGAEDAQGVLKVNDYKRSRITGGVTLSFDKPFVSDIRINFEKYFYRNGGIAKASEKDKIVIEFVTHF